MKLYFKNNKIEALISLGLLVMGLLFIFIKPQIMIYLVAIIVGSFFLFSGISLLIAIKKNSRVFNGNYNVPLFQSIFFIIWGLLLILLNKYYIRVLPGIFFFLVSFIKGIQSDKKLISFLVDLYKYMIFLLFVISFNNKVARVSTLIVGGILIIASIIILSLSIKSFKEEKEGSYIYKTIKEALFKSPKGLR